MTRIGVGLKPLPGLLTCGQLEMTKSTSMSAVTSTQFQGAEMPSSLMLGLPTMHLRTCYLALTTTGFGEIIRLIIVHWKPVTGGTSGLRAIPGSRDRIRCDCCNEHGSGS